MPRLGVFVFKCRMCGYHEENPRGSEEQVRMGFIQISCGEDFKPKFGSTVSQISIHS